MIDASSMSPRGFFSEASSLMVSVWFLMWGIRRKGEFDIELDDTARRIRWLMVGMGILFLWASAGTLTDCAWCVLVGWIWATAFLAWPNFAYHLTTLLRKIRLLPKAM
jgi:hypothetical protein